MGNAWASAIAWIIAPLGQDDFISYFLFLCMCVRKRKPFFKNTDKERTRREKGLKENRRV